MIQLLWSQHQWRHQLISRQDSSCCSGVTSLCPRCTSLFIAHWLSSSSLSLSLCLSIFEQNLHRWRL